MAVHELNAARRWAVKREHYLEEKREKIVAALEAMQFITQMSEPEVQHSMVISSLKRQKATPPPCPSANQAKVIAAAHLQSLPEVFFRGIMPSS
jgi:hypothetical protein